MVNRGRSRGCVTCRQRRVKCDEGKPECRTCGRLGLRCGGYRTQPASTALKFRDQNHKFYGPASLERTGKSQSPPQVASLSLHSLAAPDTAVPFFLVHYAIMGRDMESARGFYEILVPEYCAQPQDSALSLAVSALASETMSMWRRGAGDLQSAEASYTQAVACLRGTVSNCTERGKTATLLAALALQMYENVAAIYGLRSGATRIHHDGALSLLPFANPGDTNNKTSAYARRYILHSEVSSALRQKRPVRSIVYSLIGSQDLVAAPANPSSTLDLIGTSVAELQASYIHLASQDCTALPFQRATAKWQAEAKLLDEQLVLWAQSVPDYWQPVKLTGGRDIDPSIPTYDLTCEIYHSCQIANVWNLWRCQRLILLKITLNSLNVVSYRERGEVTVDQLDDAIVDVVKCKQTLQELVDSLCHSVPFYLGNRLRPSTMDDFTDPTIVFPTYPPSDKPGYHPRIQPDDHKRQAIAQGHWHIMSPLGCLLTLLSEDNGQLIAGYLRHGQCSWIRAQFLRVTTLLRLRPGGSGGSVEGQRLSNPPSSTGGTADIKVEYLARRVRKGAVFLSGP
ncbi:hypothetical protein BJX61DRAFT_530246 [Aspergillus egyptiacus]|nr:hypothetical protein BJX61DRAFT_530246 [Aspergillus egyptiacus]